MSETLTGSGTCFPLQPGVQGHHAEQLLPTLITLALVLHVASSLSSSPQGARVILFQPESETTGKWGSPTISRRCPSPGPGAAGPPASGAAVQPLPLQEGLPGAPGGVVRLQRSQDHPPRVLCSHWRNNLMGKVQREISEHRWEDRTGAVTDRIVCLTARAKLREKPKKQALAIKLVTRRKKVARVKAVYLQSSSNHPGRKSSCLTVQSLLAPEGGRPLPGPHSATTLPSPSGTQKTGEVSARLRCREQSSASERRKPRRGFLVPRGEPGRARLRCAEPW